MRIRVKDLIEELQRFPPNDVVEFVVANVIDPSTITYRRPTKQDLALACEFDRADQRGFEVKIQLAQP